MSRGRVARFVMVIVGPAATLSAWTATGSPPRRQVVALRTTLPDAAEVEVPFVFYR